MLIKGRVQLLVSILINEVLTLLTKIIVRKDVILTP